MQVLKERVRCNALFDLRADRLQIDRALLVKVGAFLHPPFFAVGPALGGNFQNAFALEFGAGRRKTRRDEDTEIKREGAQQRPQTRMGHVINV